jgi:RHS repeat-associated protein
MDAIAKVRSPAPFKQLVANRLGRTAMRGEIGMKLARALWLVLAVMGLAAAGNTQAAPTVSILTPSNGASAGAPATFSLTAKATPSSGTTIKSVQYYANGTAIGSALNTSPYSYSWTNVLAGTYSLTAKATDSKGAIGTSSAVSVTVTAPTPAVSITAPSNNSSYVKGATVTLSATATVSGDTISSVQFYDGATLLGSGTASGSTYMYNWTTSGTTIASHSLTAKATGKLGGSKTSSAATVSITAPPTPSVSITAPATNSSYAKGASVSLTATATVTGDTIASVQFYDGSTLLGSGTASGSTYTYVWNTGSATVASHSITAKAAASLSGTATSSAATVKITAPPNPTVSITAPVNNSSYGKGSTVSLAATATITGDTISTVQFYDGSTLLGSGTASGSTYTYSWNTSSASVAAHSITAKAAGSLGGTATSSAITVNITSTPTPTVSITAPATNSSFTQGATVALTATATVTGDTIASVQFYDGSTLLGSGTASGSAYTYNWHTSAATVASHSITVKATATLGGAKTSSAITAKITADIAPTVYLITPNNGSSTPAPASFTVTASATPNIAGEAVTVQYFLGTAPLSGVLTTSPYSFSWTNVTAGIYSLTAIATDNYGTQTTSSPFTLMVTGPPAVSISAPAANANLQVGSAITITANASGAGSIGIYEVSFFDGTKFLGTVSGGGQSPVTLSYSWTPSNSTPLGTHNITAVATDNYYDTASSAPVAIDLVAPPNVPTVTLVAPAKGQTILAHTSPVLIATATAQQGTLAQVQFFDGQTLIGSGSGAGSTYSLTWNDPIPGAHVIIAKATDSLGASWTARQTVTVTDVGSPKWLAFGGSFTTVAGDLLVVGLGNSAYACGDNSYGLVGSGSPASLSGWHAINLPAGVTAASVSIGYAFADVLGSDGNVYAWGSDDAGQLGDGAANYQSGLLFGPRAVSLNPGVGAAAVSAGVGHTLAIGTDGNLYGWGDNTYGEVGTGPGLASPPTPVALPGGASAIGITAGESVSYAIGSDGILYAWGSNSVGQLGNGTTTNSPTPVVVQLPAGVSAVSVSAGSGFSAGYAMVVGTDGNLYAFGDNGSGDLGDGTTVNRSTPVKIALPSGVSVVSAAAGSLDSLARGSDGKLYGWGSSTYGQLDGTTANALSPIVITEPIPSATPGFATTALANGGTGLGGFGALGAMGSDGKLYDWGWPYSPGYFTSTAASLCNGTIPALPMFSTASGAFWADASSGQTVAAGGFTLTAQAGPTVFGTYTFTLYEGSTALQSKTIVSSTGSYPFQIATSAGSHAYTATILGPDGTSQTTAAVTVNAIAGTVGPTVQLVSPASGAVFGAKGAFVLRAEAQAGSAPITQINYYQGSTLLTAGSPSTPVYASITTPGSYQLTAVAVDANGNSTTSPAVPITIQADVAVSISSPANNSAFVASSSIQLAASAATLLSPEYAISQVAYYDGSNLIGTATTPPYALTWANVAPGYYTLTATASDTGGNTATSAPIVVQVVSGGTTAGSVTVTYLHTDVAGSPLAATDSTGSLILWRENYQPFGLRDNNADAASGNRQFFHGQAADPESGLSYFGARYYDPVVGRFTGTDPKGFDESNIDSFNRYCYGNNNPYKYRDPDGRAGALVLGLGAVIVTGIVVWEIAHYDEQKQWLEQFGDSIGSRLREALRGDMNAEQGQPPPSTGAGTTAGGASALPKPAGIPDHWVEMPTKGDSGRQWVNPDNNGDRVRVMPGDPNSSNPAQREPYVRDVRNGNQWLDTSGNRVEGKDGRNSPDTHIPVKDYVFPGGGSGGGAAE